MQRTTFRSVVTRNSDKAVLADTGFKYKPFATSNYWLTHPPGYQVTDSENHPSWKGSYDKGTLTGDVGGNFYSRKQQLIAEAAQWTHAHGTRDVTALYGTPATRTDDYDGPFLAMAPDLCVFPPEPSGSNLYSLGATAIDRCKPTNNVADLATALIELRNEGIPKILGATLWAERTSLARALGGEYLNSEFGWKPMISDIQNIVSAVAHASDILDAYERGSGQVVRRRYTFPAVKTESRMVAPENSAPRAGRDYTPHGSSSTDALIHPSITAKQTMREYRTWKQAWFSGAFTYHLPTGYRSRNALIDNGIKAKKLLGLDLNPETLWNVMPWSWAIDWFTNAGDVISNLTDWANDGLVLKYGYMMEHCFSSYRYYVDSPSVVRGSNVSPMIAYIETKRRQVASPFGFDITWSGFSPRQVAISVALGLTHRG